MKEYKVKLNLDGYVKIYYINLENDLTEDELDDVVADFVNELFDWDYKEVINE